MVTTVLIGNRHFWTAGNKKNPKAIVTKFCTCDYVGLVNLCANFGSNRLPGNFSAYAWNLTLLSLFNALSIFQSLIFPCACPQVERLNQYWWLMTWTTHLDTRKCLLLCEWWKITLTTPKTVTFFDPVGKSQPKLNWSITFKRYNLATSLYYTTYRNRG